MTNLGPLTTTFTPTGANCQSTYFGANNDNGWLQYGQPNTAECVPTSFKPFEGYFYSPGVCPSGYTYACSAGVGSGSTQATCCPSGYQCRTNVGNRSPGGDPFGCASYYSTDTYLTMDYWKVSTVTDGSASGSVRTTSKLTTFYAASTAGFYVEAYGPILRRSGGDPAWGSATSSTSSDVSTHPTGTTALPTATTATTATTAAEAGTPATSAEPDGGLSAGAKAGIGVGAALGAVILVGCVAAAYMVGKKRRRAEAGAAVAAGPASGPAGAKYSARPAPGQAAEMDAAWVGYFARQELGHAPGPVSEMGSGERPAELHG